LPAGEADEVQKQLEDAVELALVTIKESKTREELVKLWKEIPGLHANQRVIDALNERQREINEEAA
jgi:hypothetical protein